MYPVITHKLSWMRRNLFAGKMNLELKKRIIKCLVWSVAVTVRSQDMDADASGHTKID